MRTACVALLLPAPPRGASAVAAAPPRAGASWEWEWTGALRGQRRGGPTEIEHFHNWAPDAEEPNWAYPGYDCCCTCPLEGEPPGGGSPWPRDHHGHADIRDACPDDAPRVTRDHHSTVKGVDGIGCMPVGDLVVGRECTDGIRGMFTLPSAIGIPHVPQEGYYCLTREMYDMGPVPGDGAACEERSPQCDASSAVHRRNSSAGPLTSGVAVEDMFAAAVLASPAGDPDAALAAADAFCWGTQWMMNIGDRKGVVLDNAVGTAMELLRTSAPNAVEFGTYCGYGSTRIARLLPPAARLWTVDIHGWPCGKKMTDHAGLNDRVQHIVSSAYNSAGLLLHLLGRSSVGLLFIDHAKSEYLADLRHMEELGVLAPGAVVVADNVGVFHIDDYLAHVRTSGGYSESYFHMAHLEYDCTNGTGRKDAVEVSTYRGPPAFADASPPTHVAVHWNTQIACTGNGLCSFQIPIGIPWAGGCSLCPPCPPPPSPSPPRPPPPAPPVSPPWDAVGRPASPPFVPPQPLPVPAPEQNKGKGKVSAVAGDAGDDDAADEEHWYNPGNERMKDIFTIVISITGICCIAILLLHVSRWVYICRYPSPEPLPRWTRWIPTVLREHVYYRDDFPDHLWPEELLALQQEYKRVHQDTGRRPVVEYYRGSRRLAGAALWKVYAKGQEPPKVEPPNMARKNVMLSESLLDPLQVCEDGASKEMLGLRDSPRECTMLSAFTAHASLPMDDICSEHHVRLDHIDGEPDRPWEKEMREQAPPPVHKAFVI